MKIRKEQGFSLIDLVLVIIVLGIVSLAAILFMKPVTDLWGLQNYEGSVATEARFAMDRMVREMDQVKSSNDIVTMTATTFRFRDTSANDITYTLTSGSLMRNAIPLMKNVSSLQFQYYDQQNASTSTASSVRRIAVSFQVTQGGKTLSLSFQLTPRNLQI